MALRTRSFLLERDGKRQFWDVAWDGPNVEISSGKWGTNGRSREVSFSTEGERDDFIAREVAKIVKKGYLETGGVAPAVDTRLSAEKTQARKLIERIEERKRVAYHPIFDTKEDGATRIRGPMSLDRGESWPLCSRCREPLTALFELDLTALPVTALRRDAVAQLFWCEAWQKREDAAPCSAHGGHLARLHRPTSHRIEGPRSDVRTSAIVDWTHFEEHPPYGLLPASVIDALENESVEFIEVLLGELGLPIPDTLSRMDRYESILGALGAAPASRHKLGGHPTFVQQCHLPWKEQLFQIEESAPFSVNFGDRGAGHLLLDGAALHFFWSCH